MADVIIAAVAAAWLLLLATVARHARAAEAARWDRISRAGACTCPEPHVPLSLNVVPGCVRCRGVIRV